MLKRKVLDRLDAWKRDKSHQGLLITGARQVGKTTAVRSFAKERYRNLAEINFFDNTRAIETINGATSADDLFMRIGVLARQELVPGNTLVFLDEVQECANEQRGGSTTDVLTWLKFLLERHDVDFIFSGSLLGLEFFKARSLPVGFLQTIEMRPLDFEEYCWGRGISQQALSLVRTHLAEQQNVPDYLHETLVEEFYRYLLVGGMPDAVQAFVDSNSLVRARNIQRGIADLYRVDIAKYVENRVEARQIRMVYDAIPGQLNTPNKRFKYTRLGKNLRFANLETAFDWLEHTGVALPARKVGAPLFPLGMYEDRNAIKLYMNDIGLLTSQLMEDVDTEILNRRSTINFGSIFENAVAQELVARGFAPRYFHTSNVGEIDFVVQNRMGDISLIEVKSGKDYRRHSALNNLLRTKNYHIDRAIVLYEGNVQQDGPIGYLPIYAPGFMEL